MIVDIIQPDGHLSVNFIVPDTDVHGGEFRGEIEPGVFHHVLRGELRLTRGDRINMTLTRDKSYWD